MTRKERKVETAKVVSQYQSEFIAAYTAGGPSRAKEVLEQKRRQAPQQSHLLEQAFRAIMHTVEVQAKRDFIKARMEEGATEKEAEFCLKVALSRS